MLHWGFGWWATIHPATMHAASAYYTEERKMLDGRSPVAQIIAAALMGAIRQQAEELQREFEDVEGLTDEELDAREKFAVDFLDRARNTPGMAEQITPHSAPVRGLAAVAHEKERRRNGGEVVLRPLAPEMRLGPESPRDALARRMQVIVAPASKLLS